MLNSSQLSLFPETCYLWDFDGTLVDTEDLYNKAIIYALNNAGCSDYTDQKVKQIAVGRSAVEIPKELKKAFSLDVDEKEFTSAIDDYYLGLVKKLDHETFLIKPSVDLFIKQLEANANIAIVTGSEKRCVDYFIEILHQQRPDLKKQLNALPKVTAECYTGSKPHPEPYLFAKREYFSSCKHMVAFEDSVSGATSARRANCYTVVLIPSSNESYKKRLESIKPHHLVNELNGAVLETHKAFMLKKNVTGFAEQFHLPPMQTGVDRPESHEKRTSIELKINN